MDKNNDIENRKESDFITNFFSWLTPEKQKEKAEFLENITKKDKK